MEESTANFSGWLDDLTSRSAGKAGGLACLASGAAGSALFVKCRYSAARETMEQLARTAREDGATFTRYLAARRTGEQLDLRLRQATEPLIVAAQSCLALLAQLPQARAGCPRPMLCDLKVGVHLLVACVQSCIEIAEANLKLFDPPWQEGHDSVETVRSTLRSVLEQERHYRVFSRARTVAVIGISDESAKPAYYVPEYLKEQGYRLFGVHPRGHSLLAERTSTCLQDLNQSIDLVLIFRASDKVGAHLEDLLSTRPKPQCVWMQLGITNPAVAAQLEKRGIEVVSDRCAMQEHQRLRGQPHEQ